MSEISNLVEKVSADLLEEASEYSVTIIDTVTGAPVDEYTVATELKNPFSFDPSPFVPKNRIMDLPAFISLASDVIEDAQDRDGIIEEERVKLVQEYQPDRFYSLGDEVISFKVLKRQPGRMSSKGNSRPQRASGFDFSFRDPGHPNKSIEVQSRPIDHRVEFACWAKTAELANARALWLEKLFITHAWAFAVQGVERFYWESRGPDTLWTHAGQRLHQRPLVFFVRLREHEVFAHPILKRINYEISTA